MTSVPAGVLVNDERDTTICVIKMKYRGSIDTGDVLSRASYECLRFSPDPRAEIPSSTANSSGLAFGPLCNVVSSLRSMQVP
jgi:hypothetical protein